MALGTKRPFSAGHFGFKIDGLAGGANLGFIKKVSGGHAKTEVAVHQHGTTNLQRKQIAGVSFEPITIEVGLGMSKEFYEWINSSLDKKYATFNGSITHCDADYNILWEREFFDALITEFSVPTLEGKSTDNAYFTLKLQPRETRFNKGSGKLQGVQGDKQKHWTNAFWRVDIGGLGEGCAKIEQINWKQGVVADEVGARRIHEYAPAKVEVSNLKLSVGMQHLDEWNDWHKEFVIEGQAQQGNHRTGRITFLGQNASDELADIVLEGVGITSIDIGSVEANQEQIARFDVELYIEDLRFQHNSSFVDA